MGVPVLVMGESGSGKTAALRNFSPDEVGVICVAGKPLPFRKHFPVVKTSDYETIKAIIRKGTRKAYVIDDSQYLMCFESFRRAKEDGFKKHTEMALQMYSLVKFVIDQTPEDTLVYFLHHTDTDSNTGKTKAKTLGKMLDNQLTFEGLFSIVLYTYTDGMKHVFYTQSDGMTTAKSPMEMFEREIPNDLKEVDNTIRVYYGWNTNNKEEMTND